jgi:hypothetical protein
LGPNLPALKMWHDSGPAQELVVGLVPVGLQAAVAGALAVRVVQVLDGVRAT